MSQSDSHSSAPEASRFGSAQNVGLAVLGGLIAAALAGATAATQWPGFTGVAAIIFGMAGGVFLLRHPALLLWMLILSTPFNDYLSISVGGLNIRPYALFAALGALAIAWHLLTRSTSRTREIAWHYKGLILIVALLIVSKVLGIYALGVLPPGMTKIFCVKYVMFIGLQFAAAFVCASFIDSPERLYQVLRGWLHLSNLVCYIGLVQLVLANVLGMEQYIWHRDIISIGRPYSVFREPDVLGCYYASVVVMLIPLLVGNVKFVHRGYLWLTFFAHGLSLLLIVVRAAWVAVAMCVALYLILSLATKRYKSVLPYFNGALAVGALAVLGIAMVSPRAVETVVARFASMTNPTAESGAAYRIVELSHQLAMVRDPKLEYGGPMTNVLGHGDFSWSYWAPAVVPEEDFDQSAKTLKKGEVLVNAGFNMPLSIQFDSGIVGLALYGIFFLALAAHCFRTLRKTADPARQALLLGTFLPVMAVLVCYQFSYDPLFLVFWILLGFHLAAAYHVDREESGIDEIGVPEPA